MIHLGLHTDNWRPLSVGFEAACQKIAATGLKHIEFAALDGQNFIAALGYDPGVSLESNPRALRRFLDKLGLQVSQIDGAYPMMGPNGSAYGVHYVTQSIRFAAELGCPMVDTVDGAFETPGFTRKEVFRITCDNYRQCLAWAEDYRVVINVEPHGPYTNDIEFMRKLFKEFDSEWLRCNFDTGNTFIAGHDPLEYLKALREYIVHCHIKDVSADLAAAVAAVPEKEWVTFGIEADGTRRQWAEVPFVPGEAREKKDTQPLRYVGLRLLMPQGVLFADGSDRHHHAVVTNLPWEGGRLLQWHREKAGTVEHVQDEVKNGLGGGHVPSQHFHANAAWFKIALLAYNVVSAIRRLALGAEERDVRLKKFRLLVVRLGGRMSRCQCTLRLRLCAPPEAIARLQRIWAVFALPTQATAFR